MRIGIIGSGIAGLVAARTLVDAGNEVVVFEKQTAVGIDAHSRDLQLNDGQIVRADVPSRMFNEYQWPNLFSLYKRLGVEIAEVDMSQSLGEAGGATRLTLPHAHRPSVGLRGLLSASNRSVLKEAERLRMEGNKDLSAGISDQQTLFEYLTSRNYSEKFMFEFLYPTLSSTVLTCSYQQLSSYPALFVLRTLSNMTGSNARLYRAKKGTQDVASRLTEGVRILLGRPVGSVVQRNNCVEVQEDGTGEISKFQHVIVATQANQSAQLLPAEDEGTSRMLSQFTYESIPVFLHCDSSWMPSKKRDWSTFNMLSEGHDAACCTVWLNRFHDHWQTQVDVFQSINARRTPDGEVIARATMQRPVVNRQSLMGLEMLNEIHLQPGRRVWFSGAWASPDTPLLESGVCSANVVARLISDSSSSSMERTRQ